LLRNPRVRQNESNEPDYHEDKDELEEEQEEDTRKITTNQFSELNHGFKWKN
jgi:hypothetical protein